MAVHSYDFRLVIGLNVRSSIQCRNTHPEGGPGGAPNLCYGEIEPKRGLSRSSTLTQEADREDREGRHIFVGTHG